MNIYDQACKFLQAKWKGSTRLSWSYLAEKAYVKARTHTQTHVCVGNIKERPGAILDRERERDQPYRFITAKEFAEAYESFHEGRRMAEEISIPYDKNKSHPAALTTKTYGVNKKELLKACISREFLLMKRNSFVYIFKLFQVRTQLRWRGCIFFI